MEKINKLLETPLTPDEILTVNNNLDDDDSWMDINPKQLESLLEATKVRETSGPAKMV